MEAIAGEYIKNYFNLKRSPRISLHCKLVPVQFWEYEYGLLLKTKLRLILRQLAHHSTNGNTKEILAIVLRLQ